MQFLRNLIKGKSKPDSDAAASPEYSNLLANNPRNDRMGSVDAQSGRARRGVEPLNQKPTVAVLKDVNEKLRQNPPAARGAAANIWDLDDDAPKTGRPVAKTPAGGAAPVTGGAQTARARRTKTRLIGFESSDGGVRDAFDETKKNKPAGPIKFPVGWVFVTDGPGRGSSYSLLAGMSQIGRGEDQAIQLDFGDNAISRQNHAAIAYDPKERTFLLGHGGKANIVRLNGTPVISTEPLKSGDVINIGETTLQLVTLCGPQFDWSDDTGTEENEDVAIA